MVSFPPCKINLGLHVTAKRPDGYHDLVTCFYPVPWFDVLEVVPSASFQFSLTGREPGVEKTDNLCVRAYEIMRNEFSIPPVSMHLHKILPIGAGLGGGSSDAAHSLQLLNSVFSLALTPETLKRLAATLGSDCPFFIASDKPMIGTGRGEILSEVSLSLKGTFLVIAKPDVAVSTREAYAAIRPAAPSADLARILEKHALPEWKDLLKNDFEPVVAERFPVIAAIKQTMYDEGALYASMSGSGSAVYGLFERQVNLKKNFEGMTTWAGFLN